MRTGWCKAGDPKKQHHWIRDDGFVVYGHTRYGLSTHWLYSVIDCHSNQVKIRTTKFWLWKVSHEEERRRFYSRDEAMAWVDRHFPLESD